MKLEIIPTKYFKEYLKLLPTNFIQLVANLSLKKSSLTTNTFDFYASIASVYSSKIEGEDIELDSFLKHKFMGGEYLPDYTKRADDLLEAYQFASTHSISRENIIEVHKIITRNFLSLGKRGAIRNSQMMVTDKTGNIAYVAAELSIVESEMEKWFDDVEKLNVSILDIDEAFYFASMLHLTLVNIHPFIDGNGRTSRLLEKWFLADYVGKKTWNIESERYYYENRKDYYKALNRLGFDYTMLDYNKSLPFLLLLPTSLQL